ncbi:MAG: thiamine pyrophosphate-dependent dehydrogenase E1 component subunit alpha [Thermodesulfobacteriota bacterium]
MEKISNKTLIDLYTKMLRIRLFEEKIIDLYPAQDMKCPVHLCIGQEAIAAGVCANLNKDDYLFSNHRGHGHAIAKGTEMAPLMAEFYGRVTGCSKGKGGSMHLIDTERGILGTSAIVGGGIPMGVGSALASRIKKDGKVTVVFFGDGASDEGVLYESINFAALKKLPVVFVCENNFYATNSHQKARHPTCEIAGTANSYGIPGSCIDGNDAEAVFLAAREAVAKARAGDGPTLIEALTYRWKGHVGPDADFSKGCRPEDELNEWITKCPVKRMNERIEAEGVMTEADVATLSAEITEEIEAAVKFGRESEYPEVSELLTDLYYTEKD